MNEQTIKNILTFLMRVDLKGSEAVAMVDAMRQLEGLMLPQKPTATAKQLDLDVKAEA